MGNNLNNIYLAADNIISSLGFTTQENMDAIASYHSGIKMSDGGIISDHPILAGTICTETLLSRINTFGLEEYNKIEQLIILSVKELLLQKEINFNSPECALIISTTKGNVHLLKNKTEEIDRQAFLGETASAISDYFGLGDRITVISNACISGISALVVACRLLQSSELRHVVVVGIDILSNFITSGFASFKSLSETICKPYDASRDGLNMGEACGSILLTKDNTPNSVMLKGGAISNDANHISGPSRTGDGLFFAMKGAMDDANISSKDIDFVNLHGTATVYNDEMEAKAMHLAQLEDVPANSLKPYFGHTLGASGIIETIACIYQLQKGIVFATPNYSECGVSLPLKVSAEHILLPSRTCLKTASGFGGCNAAIILSLDESTKIEEEDHAYNCTRICSISENKIKLNDKEVFSSEAENFPLFIREALKDFGESNPKFYKMDDLSKLGYIAALHLLKDISFDPTEIGIVLSNSASSLDTDKKHQAIIDTDGDAAASPAIFVYTLPNIVAGEICIRHKIQGENTFFVTQDYDENRLRNYAEIAMNKGNLRLCIYGWCEFLNNEYKAEFRLLEKK